MELLRTFFLCFRSSKCFCVEELCVESLCKDEMFLTRDFTELEKNVSTEAGVTSKCSSKHYHSPKTKIPNNLKKFKLFNF